MSSHCEASDGKEECLPLKSLDEILSWEPSNVHHVTTALRDREERRKPKILVCHDMQGGYLDDRFVHGVKKCENFSFIHWACIDVFVYFSHCLVTVPPCSWINAAHTNGTLILGTFITEWEQGALICDELLNSKESIGNVCDKLVSIALCHGFDGWLVNIENKIKPDKINFLQHFVSCLTSKMHQVQNNSLVIWYDSVISTGELKWQDELNEHNRDFFDACDGIFLNYNWKTENLKKSVLVADSRSVDVFAGVDVFGRGSVEGRGGFQTNNAVQAAQKIGVSAAIFAPGWLYECLDPKMFLENLHKLWDELGQFCSVRCFKTLPFLTTFCPGFGMKMYRKGKVISSNPWHNLGLQQPQPNYSQLPDGYSTTVCISDAYNGGGCMKFNVHCEKQSCRIFHVFSTLFKLKEPCAVTYSFKSQCSSDTCLNLSLSMTFLGIPYSLNLVGDKDSPLDVFSGSNKTLFPARIEELQEFDNQLCVEPENCGWIKRTYILDYTTFKHHMIKAVNVFVPFVPEETRLSLLLGNLEIIPLKPKPKFSCHSLNKSFEGPKISLNCMLEWNNFASIQVWDLFYQLTGGDEVYICSTSQLFYKVNLELELDYTITNAVIYFHLYSQANCDKSGEKQSLKIDL